jgi:hypothetical protein
MIKKVYLWTNNNVTVYDEKGERVTDCEGLWNDVRMLISVNSNEDTEFYLRDAQGFWTNKITLEEFMRGV